MHHTRSRTPPLDDVTICHQWRERRVLIDVKIDPSPHVREMSFSNGIIITSDRGIDIYRAPVRKGQWRTTHRALVEVKKFEHEQLTQGSPSPAFFNRRRFRPTVTKAKMEMMSNDASPPRILRAEKQITPFVKQEPLPTSTREVATQRELAAIAAELVHSIAREKYDNCH